MKSILITGGSGGLGTVVTLRLIAEGYHCIVPYRTVEQAQKLRTHLAPQQRDQLLLIEADVLQDAEALRVFEVATAQNDLHGFVHLLGGIRSFNPIADTSVEDWDALINLNLRSLFLFSRLAMQYFQKMNSGRIVTVAAMAALKPAAAQGPYGVAKAGVSALTKILADEGRKAGITANCILPSIIRTEANLEWGTEKETAAWISPEEIAASVHYLLSDEARGVNGTDLRLFGGMNI